MDARVCEEHYASMQEQATHQERGSANLANNAMIQLLSTLQLILASDIFLNVAYKQT